MNKVPSADIAEWCGEQKAVPIPRVSIHDDVARLLDGPVVFTDALAGWPAAQKWSIDYFVEQFGDHFGLIPASFLDGSWGKATSLRDFAENLDQGAAHTPGFWVDRDGLPLADDPSDGISTWSFYWRAFRDYPQLRDDIGAYPSALSNLAQNLPGDVAAAFEKITKRDFFAIYMSRQGTVTPLHRDFHGTTGSLAQFEGNKWVTLIAHDADDTNAIGGFDPERPDFDAFPQLRGRAVYQGRLSPGDLVIIPSKWWHHVRSEDHTLTLSHNFFTPANLGEFLRGMLQDLATRDTQALEKLLHQQIVQNAPSILEDS